MKLSDYRKQTSEKANESVFKKSFKKMVSMYKGFKTKMDFAVNTVKKTYQTNLQAEMEKRGLVMTPKSLDEQFKEKYGNVIYRNIDRDSPVFQNKIKMLSHVQKETGKEMIKAEEKQEDFTRQIPTRRRRFGDPDTPEEIAQRKAQEEKDERERQERIERGEEHLSPYRTVSKMNEDKDKWLKRANWLGFETTEQFWQWKKDVEAEKEAERKRLEDIRDMMS